jgi:hypothetical protein
VGQELVRRPPAHRLRQFLLSHDWSIPPTRWSRRCGASAVAAECRGRKHVVPGALRWCPPSGAPAHYVKLTGAHRSVAGSWAVAGVEWRPTHLRLLLKRGFPT